MRIFNFYVPTKSKISHQMLWTACTNITNISEYVTSSVNKCDVGVADKKLREPLLSTDRHICCTH